MNSYIFNTVGFLLSYFMGSIPFGLIIGKITHNKDIRLGGSGNVGATNGVRLFGLKTGILIFLLDGLKTLIPGMIGYYFSIFNAEVFCTGVFLGHIFSIFLKFKGGKGVTVFIFSLLILNKIILLAFLIIFIIVFFITKYVSLSSIIASVSAYIVSFIIGEWYADHIELSVLLFITNCVCIILYKHIQNIRNLVMKTELKFNSK